MKMWRDHAASGMWLGAMFCWMLAPPSAAEAYWEARLGRIEVIATGDSLTAIKLVRNLEYTEQTLRLLTGFRVDTANVPLQVVLLSSNDWDGFAGDDPPWRGRELTVDAAHVVVLNSRAMPHRQWSLDQAVYARQLLSASDQALYPPWYQEGLVEMMRSLSVRTNSVVRIGRMPPIAAVMQVRSDKITARELLERRDINDLGEREDVTFKGRAWFFAHYVLVNEGGARRQQYLDLARDIVSGGEAPDALQARFRLDPEALDATLNAHMGGNAYLREMAVEDHTPQISSPRRLPASEVRAKLMWLRTNAETRSPM